MDLSKGIIEVIKVIAQQAVVPAGRQVQYMLCYKSNIDELEKDMKKLEDSKERMQHRVHEATLKGEMIEDDVQRCQNTTEKLIKDAGELIASKGKASCFYFIPNPYARHQLGRKATKAASAIISHHREVENFEQKQISYQAAAVPSSSESAQIQVIPLHSRDVIMNEIMDALGDNNIEKIGVHGAGGVGKTTLLVEVEQKARESNKFDEVIRKVVAKNPNVRVIGADLSNRLGMLDKKDDGRGSGKKKALIILDDLWEEHHFKLIWADRRYDNVEVKLLLSSRDQELLDGLGCRPNFSLNVLNRGETAKLFAEIAGGEFGDPKADPLAAKLVEKCEGYPLRILPLARMLKDKVFSSVEDALEHIKKLDAGYDSLELSYQSLGEKNKELFLCCGLIGNNQNIPVRYLLKYNIGLDDSLGGTNIVERARRQMVESLRKLQAWSMLSQGDDKDHVKMHDVVRDFSYIAKKDSLVIVDGKRLLDLSPEELEKLTTISLPHAALQTLTWWSMWRCPNLTTFISHAGDSAELEGDPFNVLNFFFEDLRKLRVLDIRSAKLASLPSSVHFLQNLTTLCLDDCDMEDVSIIGKLKSLQVLSFVRSQIKRLPKEIGELTNLILLDLSNCSKLKVIDAGVLERLTKLEELYLDESFHQWAGVGGAPLYNASLAELNKLPRLRTLDVCIPDPMLVLQVLPFGRLERYRILIGVRWDWSGNHDEARTMKLEVRSWVDFCFQQWAQLTLQNVQDLHLYGFSEGANQASVRVDALCVDGFKQLKRLQVGSSTAVQYIVFSTEWTSHHDAFPMLESLFLQQLDKLVEICHGPIASSSFGRLKVIKVEKCDELRNMFSLSILKGLSQLEEIEINECKMMQEVVLYEGKDDDEEEEKEASRYCKCYSKMESLFCRSQKQPKKVELANLRRLKLRDLPEIRRFFIGANPERSSEIVVQLDGCGISSNCFLNCQQVCLPKLEILEIYGSPKLTELLSRSEPKPNESSVGYRNLKSLTVRECHGLSKVIGCNILLMDLQNLEKLKIDDCKMLTEVFNLEGLHEKHGHAGILPRLSEIDLSRLGKLSCIWNKCPQGVTAFQNLKSSAIWACPELTYVFTPSMAKAMGKLTKLIVARCKKMHAIVTDEDNGQMEFCASSCNVEFPSLNALFISECPNLKEFYSIKGVRKSSCCPIRAVRSSTCCGKNDHHQLGNYSTETVFFSRMVLLPSLVELELDRLVNPDKIWDNEHLEASNFSKLEVVEVKNCKNLRTTFPLTSREKRWQNLKKAEISFCDSLESVFEVDGDGRDFSNKKIKSPEALMLPELQLLKLEYLKNLKQVWSRDVSKPLVGFPSLTKLTVGYCGSLMDLIPFTMATTLLKLEILKVYSCEHMRQVVSRGNSEAKQMNVIIIPRLRSMELLRLERLECFFSGSSISFLFPCLTDLSLIGCEKMKAFIAEDGVSSHSLFNEKFLLPNLEKLQVSDIQSRAIWKKALLPSLVYLNLRNLPNLEKIWDNEHLETSNFSKLEAVNVYGCKKLCTIFLLTSREKRWQNLKEVHIHSCDSWESVFEVDGDGQDFSNKKIKRPEALMLPELQLLELDSLMKLKHVVKGDVSKPVVGFPNLTQLAVKWCYSLIDLIPFTTAATLLKLETLEIYICPLMRQVVSRGNSEASQMDVIIIPRLRSLNLSDLESLECFFSGSSPAFIADVEPQSSGRSELKHSHSIFNEKFLLPNLEELRVSNIQLREIWKNHLPAGTFSQLKFLEVKGCSKLLNIVPSFMRKTLRNLERIKVISCSSVECVYEAEGSNIAGDSPSACRVDRQTYPPEGAECVEQLQELWLYNCQRMQYIIGRRDTLAFPRLTDLYLVELPALCRFRQLEAPSLNKLVVRKCGSLEDVVCSNAEAIQIYIHLLTFLDEMAAESSRKRDRSGPASWHVHHI